MKEFFKKLFCSHKYKMIGNPYLAECGTTKRCNFECIKCGKKINTDIFNLPSKKWAK